MKQIKLYLPETLLMALMMLVGTGLILLTTVQPMVPDSLGYLVAGVNLGTGQGLQFMDIHNQTAGPFFYLHAFRMVGENRAGAVFGYPPGYPMLIALSVILSGQTAAYYITPLLGMLSLLLTYWLGWLLSKNKWVGLVAAWLLACAALFW